MANPKDTVARRRLSSIVAPVRWTQADLARAVGVTPQAVATCVSGIAAPQKPKRKILEEILGIPETEWEQPAQDQAA
jgi:ribosome-binding protein aMBF1 (putative translation factor)